ncbi:MAG: hypothetical protein F4X57_13560 [Chloroflexi bacterium]|nr:hypothetical protein [Chloroflexota bacterium]
MNNEHAKTKRNDRIGILRPITGILAVIGLIAIVVTGFRAIAGRGRAAPGQSAAAPVPPVPVPPTPPPALARAPHRRGFKRLARHPFVIAMLVVVIVLVGTVAFIPFSGGPTTIGGIELQPSDYDKFFTYSQMEAMTHFAKCDAMLFSTRPAEELMNVMERMAIEVEFGGSTGAAVGEYLRRVRSPEEIAETIRLAGEFYERVNCF